MKKLNLFYVTYDGIKSLYCGVGSDTQIILSSLGYIEESIAKLGYQLELHMLYAEVPTKSRAYSEEVYNISKTKLDRKNIKLYELRQGDKVINPFGTIETWRNMCEEASKIIKEVSGDDLSIVIANDTPFAKLCAMFNENKNIYIVWRTASTQKIWDHPNFKVESGFIEWEYYAANGANKSDNVFIGANCKFMKEHMIKDWDVREEKIILLTNGVSKDYFKENIIIPQEEIYNLLEENNIPTDKKLFISFGRAIWYKGLDIACRVVNKLSKEFDDVYFLVFASNFGIKESIDHIEELNKIFNVNSSKGKLFTEYKFDLPQKLMQWKNTRMVGVFSRREPFGSIPSEVRIVGPDKAVVVASDVGGLSEQIEHNKNGYLVNPENIDEVIDTCRIGLSLTDIEAREMNQNAKEKVENDYIFFKNITYTISELLQKSGLIEEK